MELEKESFELQFIGRELNATLPQQNSALHARLIAEAKKVRDLPGALYLATEAMPFDVLSGNFKRTPYNSQSKAFAQTAITPYYRPILYSHDDGSGGMFMPGMKPVIAGRVLSSIINDNGRGGKSIFTGQVITDKDSIERVNSFIDYSQSISFYPQAYTCDVCGADPMKGCGLEEDAQRCYNLGKEVNETGNKKRKVRVTWSVLPSYIAEISFVATPAYQDAMVLGIEQNSLGQGLVSPGGLGGLTAFYNYVKKEGFVTVGDIPTKANQTTSEKTPPEQNSGTIGSESNQEQDEMELKELKEQLDAFKKEFTSSLEAFDVNMKALAAKVEASLKPAGAADTNAAGGTATGTESGSEQNAAGAQTVPAKTELVIPEAFQKVLNEINENTKKANEQYTALAEKVDKLGTAQAPGKTEAELEAEKNEADRVAKEAADAAAAAAALESSQQGTKTAPAAPVKTEPRLGKLAQSLVKR